MAEQVNIASLTIDVDDVIKESVRLQKEMNKLKKTQELDRTTDEGAAAYEKSAAELKNLSKAYRDNQKFAAALDATNEDLTKTMSAENKSTQQLRDSRADLNQISKNIQGDTEEEIALREELNVAINNQTEALKNQAPEYIEQKENIGAYTAGIDASQLSLRGLVEQSQEAGGATKLFAGGIKAGTKAMGGLIKATLKFIATPIGAILAVLVGAFFLIKNAMDRSEDSTNKIKLAMSGFSGAIKGLMKFLEPLGDFLIDGLVKGFELVEKGIAKAVAAIQKGLRFLGLDEAADSLESFTGKIDEAVKVSKQLTQAEIDLQKAQRISRKIQLDFQKQAEKLRQIRDDETKSFEERIKANDDLGKSLKRQSNEELAIANKALELAKLRINLEGESTKALDERAAALTEIADIQERISGQESEQIVNRVSLEKELAALKRENAEEVQRLAEEFQDQMDAELEAELEALEEKTDKEIALALAKNEIILENNQAKNEIILENNQAKNDELLRQELDRIAQEKDAEQALANIKRALINSLFNFSQTIGKRRISNIQQQVEAGTKTEKEGANQIATIQRRQAIIDKAQGLFNVGINTATGITKAGAQLGAFAIPVQIALAALGAIQTGIILTSPLPPKPKFASGGMVRGAGTGKSDSISAMLSNGESVNNARSTSMFAPLYSYLNELGGGAKFASGGIAGTSTASSSVSIVNYDLLASKMVEAVESLPPPIVGVDEITRVSNNVTVIEDLSIS